MNWYVLKIALPGVRSVTTIVVTRKSQVGSCGIRGRPGLCSGVVLGPIRLGWGSFRVLVVIPERWLLRVDLGSAKGVSNEWCAGGFEARWSGGGLGRERLV
jgi:hypothetical protein